MQVVVRHEGGLKFTPPDAAVMGRLSKILDRCDREGGYVLLDVSAPRKARTTGERSQNNHFYFLVREIARETGNEVDDVKDAVKDRAIKRGYPYRVNRLTSRIKPLSTACADTAQCSMLIDECYLLAGELGIILPPNPYGGD